MGVFFPSGGEDTTQLWLPAPLAAPAGGAPGLGGSSHPLWTLDSATNEVLLFPIPYVPGWGAYTIDLWWTNLGAGAGNVVFHCYDQAHASGVAEGESTAFSGGAEVYTLAAPAQDILAIDQIHTSTAMHLATELKSFSIRRQGADAADTLGNDAALFGLMLHKA